MTEANGKEGSVLGARFDQIGPTHDYITGERAMARDRIMEDIIPSADMESLPCLCGVPGGQEDEVIATIDRWGLPARSVMCGRCGLIRIDPAWDDRTYARIYESYFWPLQIGESELTRERWEGSVKRARSYSEYLMAHIDLRGKDVLEIGCSWGAGLYALKDDASRLTGYDLDERVLEAGRGFTEFDLRKGGVAEAVADGEKYDLVILRHVLEHFRNPGEHIEKLTTLLKPEGLMFIEVPGTFNCPEDILMLLNVFHYYNYSLANLESLMGEQSFELVEGDERVYSIWKKADGQDVKRCEPSQNGGVTLEYLMNLERERNNSHSMSRRLPRLLRKIFHG